MTTTDELIVNVPPTYVRTGLQNNSEALTEYLSPEAEALVLQDEEDLQTASHIINDIRARAKTLEELEKSVTRPILEGVERYRALFRPAKAAAAAARALWDGKIRVFHTHRQAAQQAAQAALQEAIETQDLPQAAAAVQALVPATKTQGLTVIDTWGFDEHNHALVPTSLMVLNPAAVRAEIERQMADGFTEPVIPGLSIYRTQVVRGTSRGGGRP